MADNYKILGQTTAASIEGVSGLNQANVVYTVPENTQASVSSISLTNSSATAENYYLGVVKAGEESILEVPDVSPAFVAVAPEDARAAYSTDGISWTQTTLPTASYWASVTYGGGKFVAVAAFETSTAAYSTDGITWTQTPLTGDSNWKSVTYGDGKFVAVASNSSTAAYSTDGISWTQTTLPTGGSWQSVTYGDGKFVALNQSNSIAAYSTDGITWTQTTLPTGAIHLSVTYGGGKFVAVSSTNKAAYSTDGISWTQTTLPATSYWISVTYGGGKFVAVAQSNTNIAAYSTDGISWTQATMTPGIYWWESVTYGESTPGYSLYEISNAQTIVPNRSIEPNQVDEIVGGITLSAGDQIRVYSESEDLVVQVYGVEIA